jgi:hypothetical protein
MKRKYKLQRSTHFNISQTIITLGFVLAILVSSAFGQQINIGSGAYLNIAGAAHININNGDFVNNGTYTKGTETITFSGNSAITISGTSNTDFNNVSITSTGGVTTQLGQLVANNFTISLGSKFTINPTKAVMVSGILTNSASTGGLVLKSDVTGTASLIHNTNSVPATVQRYISGNAEDWHFISPPVSNQPISSTWLPSGTYGNGTGYDLYLWNEPNSCWIYNLDVTSPINWSTVHTETDFVAGRGYLYSVQAANPTKEFVGSLNNGLLNFGLTFSGSDIVLKGFNLVGNPYPSSVNWSAASGWTRTNLDVSGGGYNMWIWNPAANNYGVFNSADGDGVGTNSVTQFIAPMQGFFVQAQSAGNLGMDNNVRVNDGASWFKSSKYNGDKNEMVALTVTSDNGNGFDEIQLGFGYSKNENGATKLFSRVPTAPSLYMVSGSDNLSVGYLTNTQEHPAVPIKFTPGATGNFTINCNFDPFNFETVVLEDRKTNTFHNLKAINEYSFCSTSSDDSNRFVLYFGPVNSNSDTGFPARAYTANYQLVIDLSLVSGDTETYVYDIMGRLLLHKKLQGETLHNLNLNAQTQTVIVSFKNPAGGLNQKVFWNGNR